MLSWKDIIQKYIIKHADQIKKTTQPLKDRFGIEYFTYHRIDNQGKYTVLVDHPEWAEHYVDKQIFLNDPYLRHPSVYQAGITLVENQGSQEYQELVLREGKRVLNMDTMAILIQKGADFVEFYGFGGNRKTSCLSSLYLNHNKLLKMFAEHFKGKTRPILAQMEREAGSLAHLKGKDFFSNLLMRPTITSTSLLDYYRDLGIRCETESVAKLTPREHQCLKLFMQEKTAKETAAVLGLSRRTVESYFENIKAKLSCHDKPEILKLARKLEEIGLIP